MQPTETRNSITAAPHSFSDWDGGANVAATEKVQKLNSCVWLCLRIIRREKNTLTDAKKAFPDEWQQQNSKDLETISGIAAMIPELSINCVIANKNQNQTLRWTYNTLMPFFYSLWDDAKTHKAVCFCNMSCNSKCKGLIYFWKTKWKVCCIDKNK